MNTIIKLVFTSILVIHGMRSAAIAQAQTANEKACANSAGNSAGKNLSDKLAQSGGVICPPRVGDPDIKAPTPNGGTMPVIPPPGSPGGNPNVQPK
ncbi:MAG TPA: hypothetical protein VHY10_09375 [Xanthobacteraceae bacterium]|nr:hypothetical protein [Xanthobacteraceae bacterium]